MCADLLSRKEKRDNSRESFMTFLSVQSSCKLSANEINLEASQMIQFDWISLSVKSTLVKSISKQLNWFNSIESSNEISLEA